MNASNGMACDIFFSPLVALLSMYHFFPMDLQTIENKSMCFYSGNQLQKMRTVYLIYYDFGVFKQYRKNCLHFFVGKSKLCHSSAKTNSCRNPKVHRFNSNRCLHLLACNHVDGAILTFANCSMCYVHMFNKIFIFAFSI